MAERAGELLTAVSLGWEGLTKSFPDGSLPLDYRGARIAAGERAVVVGASGSGKTTLLRLLAGLERPTAGRILFDRHEVQSWPAHRRRVAMVCQRPVLYPHLSIRDNLRFGGRDLDDLDRLALRLGIRPLLDRSPQTLSGGETQRVAVARAMLRRPGVLLLDEPFTHLDVVQRQELREWLLDVHQQSGATIVIVSHDPAEAWMLGQHLVVLSQGVLQQADRAQQVWDVPATRAVLEGLSETGVNWLSGAVVPTAGGWCFRGDGCEFELTGRALREWRRRVSNTAEVGEPRGAPGHEGVILGVRPTELTLAAAHAASGGLGQVVRVDWLGDRRVVQVRLFPRGETQSLDSSQRPRIVRVVVPYQETVQLDSTVGVQSGSDRLYFFDRHTGHNLLPQTDRSDRG